MAFIEFPDKKKLEIKDFSGKSILQIIEDNKNYVVALVDNVLRDLSYVLQGKEKEIRIFDFNSKQGKQVYWHTSSHIMAQAVKRLFPFVKVTIGPSIENGFYYDFDTNGYSFTPEDINHIEEEIRDIIKSNYPIIREEMEKEKATLLFKGMKEDYKLELLEEIPDDIVSIYRQGEFVDLCRGPHLVSTGRVSVVKLLSSSSSYWRGDEHNKQLQRIYGISFPQRAMLKDFLRKRAEAVKRDHRKLGKELDLFSIQEEVGPGLILWHPKGAVVRMVIEDFWRKEHIKRGYQLVYTPHVGKAGLWQTSGHLGFYRDNMFPSMKLEDMEYFVKPMNCPFHILIYKSRLRSYRDFPIKYAELGTVYRYEKSGVLHGLLRVRGFTQDDAHIFARPDQVEEEIEKVIEFTMFMLKSFGFTDFSVYISTMPPKHVGSEENWQLATESLRKSAEHLGIPYEVDDGAGAFYGPKIDIVIKDALGREWQCSTIQFDFNLPERFDMTFRDSNGNEQRPYMIHRALLGSFERFFGTLIEHYSGNLPLWLSPVQVAVLSVNEKVNDYAISIKEKLTEEDIRAEADVRNERIGYKIREHEKNKVPYMLILGPEELEHNNLTLRVHGKGNQGSMAFTEFIKLIKEKIIKKEVSY